MPKPKFRIVSTDEQPIDIGSLMRADILKRDWKPVHVWADRQRPVDLPDRKGGWR